MRQAIVALQTEQQAGAKRDSRRDPAPALKPDTKKEDDADPSKNLGRILLAPTAVTIPLRSQERAAAPFATQRPVWFQTASYASMPRRIYAMAMADEEGSARNAKSAEKAPTTTAQAKPRPVPAGAGRSAAAEALDSLSPNEELSRLAPTSDSQTGKQREIEDQIRAVQGRNTPYFRADVLVSCPNGSHVKC